MADTTAAPDRTSDSQPALKRVMGPGLLLLFIVGDVLGTGIYALTGQVAAQVGGVVWLPFLVAFLVALVTAFSYLELVTKYPQAAGAALYAHKAFSVHFVTFLVAFAVMSSGITSASTAARAFSANAASVFGLDLGEGIGITLIGLGFMTLVALVNLRGVGESVKANVVLTCVELTGLLIVIGVGVWALGGGGGDFSRVTEFDTGERSVVGGVIAATGLAFFAMVGFEDSVNMAEECKEPRRIFPKVLLAGLCLTGLIYVLVSISAIALVPADRLSEGDTPLLQVVEAGAPGFPLGLFGVITMFAVANSALINMLMASRLVYGLSRERVLPPLLGRVHPAAGRRRRRSCSPPRWPSASSPSWGRFRPSAAPRHCCCSWSSPSSTSPSSCCAATGWTPTTSAPRRCSPSSGRWRARTSPRRGRAGRRSSTGSPGSSSRSASSSGA